VCLYKTKQTRASSLQPSFYAAAWAMAVYLPALWCYVLFKEVTLNTA
jgi:hypothetical protein